MLLVTPAATSFAAPGQSASVRAISPAEATRQLGNDDLVLVADPAHDPAPTPQGEPIAPAEVKLSNSAKELVERRSEHSRTLDNGDGTYVFQSSLARVHYFDKDTKQYEPVDASLEPAKENSKDVFKNKADVFSISLPAETGAGDWTTVSSDYGSLAYRPAPGNGSKQAQPTKSKGSQNASDKSRLSYANAFGPQISLEYASSAEGLKEWIVLSKFAGINTFAFDLTTDGLTPTLLEDGSVTFSSSDGHVVFTMPAPTMEDTPASADEAPSTSNEVYYELTPANDAWRLTVVADEKWLKDHNRNYPVLIDPPIIPGDYITYHNDGFGTRMDAFISDACPNTNYRATFNSGVWAYELRSGFYPGLGNNRTLIMPDVEDIEDWNINVAHLQILGANMNLDMFQKPASGLVWYGPITTGWGDDSVTWNTQPQFASYSYANVLPTERTRFNVTALVQQWMDYTLLCAGFEFWGRGGETADFTQYYASENPWIFPVFECCFSTQPTTPVVTVSESSLASTPTVSWTFNDEMGKDQYSATLEIRQAGTSASWSCTSQGDGDSAALTAPPGGWIPGADYEVRVQTMTLIPNVAWIPSAWSSWVPFRYQPMFPTATVSASGGWFAEQDSNGDGNNDALNDTNASGRGSVTLSWAPVAAASSYNIYLSDGNTFRFAGSTSDSSWTSSGKGLFPSDSAVSALPVNFADNPYLSGGGLDLRDDPRALYLKTAGTTMDALTGYVFKVAPVDASGQVPLGNVPPIYVTLDNRTVHLAEDPRRPEYDSGDMLGHASSVFLDRGSLELDVTDLAIASYGPEAALTRHYTSSDTTATSFAPGWRFSYEQTLVVNGSTATYTDEYGEQHVFRQVVTSPAASATGGIKYTSGNNVVHVFNASDVLAVSGIIPSANVLVVGGGGGGFCNLSGGGGGGGVVSSVQQLSGTMSAIVGAGGGAYWSTNGGNSSFGTSVAYGGGRGASRDVGGWTAGNGGSGGGGAGAMASTAANQWGGAGYTGGGGGCGTPDWGIYSAGGGGGGAGGYGYGGSYGIGGMGGPGTLSAITGTLTYYGGGGGGASYFSPGIGGSGGGGQGQGGNGTGGWGSTPGTPNTGGGGGGGSNGGSGIVVVSYPTPQPTVAWVAPSGFDGTISASTKGYTLTLKDRSVLAFDTAGRLDTVTDAWGNKVGYTRAADEITITAANGQTITVAITSGGKVKSATYATGVGTRTVTYCGGAGYTSGSVAEVSYYPNTTDAYRTVYGYGTSGANLNRLASIASPDFEVATAPEGPKWGFAYDSSARLVGWQLQNTPFAYGDTSVAYSTASAAITTRYGDGQNATATYGWNPTGTLASRTTKSGTTPGEWTYTYSAGNQCASETTPIGHTERRVFDSRNNVAFETADDVSITSSVYDAYDRVVSTTDPARSTTTYTYNTVNGSSSPLRVEKTLGNGATAKTEYTYDTRGIPASKTEWITTTTNVITRYTQVALNGEPQTITVEGVALEVDASNNPTNLQSLVTQRSYDSFGNLLWEKDAEGRYIARLNAYSISGKLVVSQGVVPGTATSYAYDRLGGIRSSETSDGVTVINHYSQIIDPLGTGLEKTSYDGAGTSTVLAVEKCILDSAGKVVRVEQCDPDGAALSVAVYEYDAEGRETRAWEGFDPAASLDLTQARRTEYDAEGNVTSVREPGAAQARTTTYYPSGRVREDKQPDGGSTTYAYDAMGRKTVEAEQSGDTLAINRYEYDLGGRIVSSSDETGDDTVYTYDLLDRQLTAGLEGSGTTKVYNRVGWLLSDTDTDAIKTTTKYDKSGKTLASAVGGNTTLYEYDEYGRLKKTTDPAGQVVENTYDVFTRIEKVEQRNSTGVLKTEQIGFDSLSRTEVTTTTVSADDIVRRFSYDGSLPATTTLSYAGTTTSISIDTGTSVETRRAVSAPGVDELVRTMTYDLAKREKTASLPALNATSSRTFDDAGHITTQAGSGINGDAIYSYDQTSGRKTGDNIPTGWGDSIGISFEYAADSRLTTAGPDTYSYDAAGNLTRFTRDGNTWLFTYANGRLANLKPAQTSTPVTTAYAYDTMGRRRTQGPPATPAEVKYTYDAASRLSQYEAPGVVATYTYDSQGQRLTSEVQGSSNTTSTAYLYDGLTLLGLAGSRTDGEQWKITYHYSADGRPYAGIYTEGSTVKGFSMLTTDRGDVIALLDEDGTTFASYRYDQWGRVLSSDFRGTTAMGAAIAQKISDRQILRYAGYAYDAESKLYYCSARYYDPATMQFITKDAAKADAEESPYQYCAGDPVGKVDPSGLASISWSVSYYLKDLVRMGMRAVLKSLIYDYLLKGVKWLGYRKLDRSGWIFRNLVRGVEYDTWLARKLISGIGWLDDKVSWVSDTASYVTTPYLISLWDYAQYGTKVIGTLIACTSRGLLAKIEVQRYKTMFRRSSGYRRVFSRQWTLASANKMMDVYKSYAYLSG